MNGKMILVVKCERHRYVVHNICIVLWVTRDRVFRPNQTGIKLSG